MNSEITKMELNQVLSDTCLSMYDNTLYAIKRLGDSKYKIVHLVETNGEKESENDYVYFSKRYTETNDNGERLTYLVTFDFETLSDVYIDSIHSGGWENTRSLIDSWTDAYSTDMELTTEMLLAFTTEVEHLDTYKTTELQKKVMPYTTKKVKRPKYKN